MLASSRGAVMWMKPFVEAGADINAKNPNGTTALIYACSQGKTEAARILIEARADEHAENKLGKNAIKYALEAEGGRRPDSELQNILKSPYAVY
mmetsp:Transcript_106901/g.271437  ORF Transcript_106901/g.271437 Transcript_106901/m.271437 type:complete len:94 (+) Transcript_106901:340-621(+)